MREAFGEGWGQFSFPWYSSSEKGGRANPSLVIWENPLCLIKYPLHLVRACPVFREASGGTWSREEPDFPLSTIPGAVGVTQAACPGMPSREHRENLSGGITLIYWKVPVVLNLLTTGEGKQDKEIFCFAFLHCVLLSSLALAHDYLPSRE